MSGESSNDDTSVVELAVMEPAATGSSTNSDPLPPSFSPPPAGAASAPVPAPPNLATTTSTDPAPMAATATQTDGTGEYLRVFLRYLNRFCAIVTYPCMVVFTLVSLLMIVTFCIFPTLVCLTFGTCIYYCLMEDPIPLSVLLRYMLSPDADDTTYPTSLHPLSQQRPVIQSKLIIRKVLKIEDIMAGNNGDDANDYPRKHPFPIHLSTESKCLHFSEPLGAEQSNNDDEDDLAAATAAEENENSITEDPPETLEEAAHMPPVGDTNEGLPEQIEESEIPREYSDEKGEKDDLVEIAIEREEESEGDSGDAALAEKDSTPGEEVGPGDVDEEVNDAKKEGDDSADKVAGELDEDYFGIFESRDRGTTCDICLLEYQVGDAVAWSPNLDCTHTYHRDCVLDWLVRKPTCPNCRHDYLKGKNDENV